MRWERVAVIIFLYVFWFWCPAFALYLTGEMSLLVALAYIHVTLIFAIVCAGLFIGLISLVERVWYWRDGE